MDPYAWELLRAGDGGDTVAAVIRLNEADRLPQGIQVVTKFGDVVTARLERAQIPAVRADPATASLKAPVRLGLEVEPGDEEVSDDGLPGDGLRPDGETATGRGVLVGVIDWGLDPCHPAFRHENGATRLLAFWDQRPREGPAPRPWGYGRWFKADEIDAALSSSDPYGALGYHPADFALGERCSHGSHTLYIAAGHPRGGGPGGLASDADLVFVHLGGGVAPLSSLADSVNLLEAVDFIFKIAAGRPCVINLSLGQQAGPHDGSSPVERGLDAAVLGAPGRAICQSAGNYFNRRIHAAGELRPGQEVSIGVLVGATELVPNEVDLWYSGEDSMLASAVSPSGTATRVLAPGGEADLKEHGKLIARLYHRAHEPNNGRHHIALFIYPDAPQGQYEIRLRADDVVDGRWHAWIERNTVAPGSQPRFPPQEAVELSTTGTICNGRRTIAVGAYDAHSPGRALAEFSSRGPTRDGRPRPDLVAPGVGVLGACSAPRKPDPAAPSLIRKSGTSMASPAVAGLVALLYEIAGPIPVAEVRRLVLGNADPAAGPEDVVFGSGSGYLNVAATLAAGRAHARRRLGG